MIMTGSANSPSGCILFASKGDAVPTQRPPLITAATAGGTPLPQSALPAGVAKPGRHASPAPLSFLISRRPVVGTAPTGHGAGELPATAAVAPFRPAASCPRGPARGRPPRRSLTLRLSVGHYLRFRECAVGGETTFQGLLEALVLRFLATDGLPPPIRRLSEFSPPGDGDR